MSMTHDGRNVRTAVLYRTCGKCVSCGGPLEDMLEGWDMHHLVPRAYGGPDESWNFVPICKPCHRRVHDIFNRHLAEWDAKRIRWVREIYDMARAIVDEWRSSGEFRDMPVNWARVFVADVRWCISRHGEESVIIDVAKASPDADDFKAMLANEVINRLGGGGSNLPVNHIEVIAEW